MTKTERHNQWRKANPEKVKQIKRNWYQRYKDTIRVRIRRWQNDNHEKVYIYNLRSRLKRYGVSLEEYNRMLERANGVCELCGMEPDTHRLAIDHDHVSGKVRGLLCAICNAKLTIFESVEFREKALRYLEERS